MVEMLVFLLFIQSVYASTPYPTSQIIPDVVDKKYDQAIDKSGDALFIQTGLESRMNMMKDYGSRKAEDLGVGEVLGASLFGLKTYRSKSVSFRLTGNKVSLYQNKVTVEIPF